MESYIIERSRAPRSAYEFISSLTVKLNQDNHQLFCHILIGTIINIKRRERNGWTPVCHRLIRKHWKGQANWHEIYSEGLIEVKPYNKEAGLSNEFRVPLEIVEEYLVCFPSKTEDYVGLEIVNIFSGKVMRQVNGSKLTDDTGHPEPALVKSAMQAIERCVFNAWAIENHLAMLEVAREQAEKDYLMEPTEENEKKLKSAKHRYLNDLYCFKSIQTRQINSIGNGFFVYKPAYASQMSGRISEENGGLQSCSREMKEAAFSEVERLRNYDLKSSQPSGLIQQFELAKLDTTWLVNYINDPDAKRKYAAAVGISVDCWKDCLCATMMGAFVTVGNKTGSVAEYLAAEAGGDDEKTLVLLDKYCEVIKPLKAQLDKWHSWLLKEYLRIHGISYWVKGKQYIKNPTGKTLCITDLKGNQEDKKRRLAAFVLQGFEAGFIHHLTLLSREYDYEVLSNQHDGLITLGEIPQAAVEKAKEISGLRYATLEEKAFV